VKKEATGHRKGYARLARTQPILRVTILRQTSASEGAAKMIPPRKIRPKRIRAMTQTILTTSGASARYSYQSLHKRKVTHQTNLVTIKIVRAKTPAHVQKSGKESASIMIPLLDKSDPNHLLKIKLSRAKNAARKKKNDAKSDAKNANNAENLKVGDE
jgi:hypothetical protein